MKVLVTGAAAPAGMNAMNFLPQGVEKLAADPNPVGAKVFNNFALVPYAREPDYLEKLNQIVVTQNIDLVIPTVDEELLVLSRQPDSLKSRVLVSPKETVETCLDKLPLYERFRNEEFCPRFMCSESKEELEVFDQSRILLKPRRGSGSKNIQEFNSSREVPPELVNRNNLFVEFLPGQEFTVDTLCDLEGRLVVAVPRSRLEVDRGISSRGKTEKRQDLIQYTEKICSILKFIGPINIQFKLNQEGKPKLMDINPRMSGGFPITVASGVNPLELMVKILKGEELPKISWEERESTQKVIKTGDLA